MPRPSSVTEAGLMSPESVNVWIDTVKAKKLATTDYEVARLLGRSHDTLAAMRKRGADRTTGLACAAVLKKLQPFVAEA